MKSLARTLFANKDLSFKYMHYYLESQTCSNGLEQLLTAENMYVLKGLGYFIYLVTVFSFAFLGVDYKYGC